MSLRVEVDLDAESGPIHVGTAHINTERRSTFTTFSYAPEYLARPGAYPIDPRIPLTSGSHPTPGLPGAFSDSAPDRWGTRIITRRREGEARAAGRTPGATTDADLLLGVSDLTRQGALRFRAVDGPYLHNSTDVPKLIELPRLLAASRRFEASDGEDLSAIKELLDAGSGSLGGARPKASVRNGDQYAIAKFPHQGDQWNVIGWEAATLQIAARCGLDTPSYRLEQIDNSPVLVLDRFDRIGGARLGYMSAMTMLQETDGVRGDYLDLAETMDEFSEDAAADRRELYRRILFSIAVNNVDDHLRNHGFLRGRSGWRLSPVFDVNPHPYAGQGRMTSVGGALSRDDVASAVSEMGEYLVRRREDRETIILEVEAGVGSWKETAEKTGLSDAEIHRFTGIFEDRPSVRA